MYTFNPSLSGVVPGKRVSASWWTRGLQTCVKPAVAAYEARLSFHVFEAMHLQAEYKGIAERVERFEDQRVRYRARRNFRKPSTEVGTHTHNIEYTVAPTGTDTCMK